MSNDAQDIWTLIAAHRTAMLTTQHAHALISRPMAATADEGQHSIYMISAFDEKTRDIADDAAINLAYIEESKKVYVSVSGTARVSQDRAKLRELWSPWAQAWLPQGPDGEGVALITVTPSEATIWDGEQSGFVATVKTFAAAVRGTPPETGTVDRVTL